MSAPRQDIEKAVGIAESTFKKCGKVEIENNAVLDLRKIENTGITYGAPEYLQEEFEEQINPFLSTIITLGRLLKGGIHEIEREGNIADELDVIPNGSEEKMKLREEAAAGLAAVDIAERLYESLESNLQQMLNQHGDELMELDFPQFDYNWYEVIKFFLETLEGEREEFVRERERFELILREELGLSSEETARLAEALESEFVDQITDYTNIPENVKNEVR